MGEARPDLSRLSLKLFLLESVDEFDGGEEPGALAMMFDGLDADRRGEMGTNPTRAAEPELPSWREKAELWQLLASAPPTALLSTPLCGSLIRGNK